jgi:hypothetical protein
MPVLPVLERLRQEDLKFEANLGYSEFQTILGYIARLLFLKTKTQIKNRL